MKLLQHLATLLFTVALLAGCTVDLPPASAATVSRFERGAPVKTWQLTEAHIRSLSLWFQQHQSGWTPSFVSYYPIVYVTIQHSNHEQSSINISPVKIIVNSAGRQVEQPFDRLAIKTLLDSLGSNGG
jgi:hypothetical protein